MIQKYIRDYLEHNNLPTDLNMYTTDTLSYIDTLKGYDVKYIFSNPIQNAIVWVNHKRKKCKHKIVDASDDGGYSPKSKSKSKNFPTRLLSAPESIRSEKSSDLTKLGPAILSAPGSPSLPLTRGLSRDESGVYRQPIQPSTPLTLPTLIYSPQDTFITSLQNQLQIQHQQQQLNFSAIGMACGKQPLPEL